MMAEKFMVFDVESIGLHGEGFAVAWVVVDRYGGRWAEGCLACDPAQCAGTDESRLWVGENVPQLEQTSPTKQHLRNTFWHEWRRWADQGAVLVADCAWPVEANFLSACVKLNHDEREWQGPYPLHDLASVLLALGADALAVTERLPDELPAHHPMMDARQSARQLVECLKGHNVEVTGAARLHRAASSDRRERGRPPGWASLVTAPLPDRGAATTARAAAGDEAHGRRKQPPREKSRRWQYGNHGATPKMSGAQERPGGTQ